jgi:RimJ/RimL family protein N-acetyltransferase
MGKAVKMIKGRKVQLVAVEREHLKQLLAWRNKPEFRKHFREYRELSMAQQNRWYEEKVLNDPTTLMFSICDADNGELLGCCGLVYIHWVCKHADLSLYVGWKDSYIDDAGYAEESCRLLLDYGFKELGLNKVWTEIYVFDEKKRQLYEKLGFNVDGRLRQNCFHNGRFWDSYILSMLASEWTGLNKKPVRPKGKTNGRR